ncbi:hypothetical protein [Paenibacillus sp. CF384]|uniref:hypothetical protein n=1 Tax=Paenibacillus sp. CF384 TaxID=1884382 RepID=UPI00089B7BCC|nr:hypothetical protein [Paenibacillus sp. CF384]SDX06522.1 hypothetical protein SAMN05518855_1008126 [Paenibacillus sp. CF384]
MGPAEYSIRNPSGNRILVAMTMMISLLIYHVIDSIHDRDSIISISAAAAEHLLCVVVLITTLARGCKKPTELYLNREQLVVNGRNIQAKDMKVILIMGYFRPTIGIKPHGKNIVPIQMCFRFAKDEDQGISDLGKWAVQNDVKLVHKRFLRWI